MQRSRIARSLRPNRAAFLGGAAAALAAPALASPLPRRGTGSAPTVVIVGAGVAGLTCAYRLNQAGIASRVYEASDRIGGRTWTLRDYFAQGQIAEHGGELISIHQFDVQKLSAELGLTLLNANRVEPGNDTYFFNGTRYTVAAARADYFAHVYDALRAAERAAGFNTKWNEYTQAGRLLDNMSVQTWIEHNVPDGMRSRIGQLLAEACTEEYGADPAVQSALNLVYLLGDQRRGRFDLDGTNEAFVMNGGIDQIATRLAAALPSGTIETGAALVAIAERASGDYLLTFTSGSNTSEVVADLVCLAIPFTMLRQVDTSQLPLHPRHRLAIERLPMGTNAKVHLQFRSRLWNHERYDGASFVQFAYQNSWDVSAGQAGEYGILVGFPGGSKGLLDGPAHGPCPRALAERYLHEFDRVFPGVAAEWTGAAYVDIWARDPWHLGSYSYYGVGDYTTFAGIEGKREGRVSFAGEQTSYENQGYINGAVVSGERAAREIAA
jgi:monoamine oxidase